MPTPLSTVLVAVAAVFAAASAPLWLVILLGALAIANELFLVLAGPQ